MCCVHSLILNNMVHLEFNHWSVSFTKINNTGEQHISWWPSHMCHMGPAEPKTQSSFSWAIVINFLPQICQTWNISSTKNPKNKWNNELGPLSHQHISTSWAILQVSIKSCFVNLGYTIKFNWTELNHPSTSFSVDTDSYMKTCTKNIPLLKLTIRHQKFFVFFLNFAKDQRHKIKSLWRLQSAFMLVCY